ncbi:MAG TPA: efflux RND transporter permease subunit [Pseudomonadales bacterium]|nr:efflux RND transporter permease subunit [Pseudomonadales bacterium]
MNSAIDWAVQRSRTTLSILAMVLIAGLYSYVSIPVESEPNIQVPVFVITVPHEGISPEDAERLLVMPMETELRAVEGVKQLTAYASEGAATLVVEFEADFEAGSALIDVREAVDKAKVEIPTTAEEPIVQEITTTDFPIIRVNFAGAEVPERVLYNLAVRVKDELEAIPDVLEANLRGQREEVLEVIIDPALLETYDIDMGALVQSVAQNNRLIPAGAMDASQGRFSIKVPGIIEDAADLYGIPVKSEGATVVTLADLATIRRTFKDRTNYARVNGVPAISVEITKRVSANLIDTVATVRETVDDMRDEFPSGVRVFFSQDQAPDSQKQVDELTGNIVTALALVMTLVVAALGLRSGILVGLAIPTSFLFSVILLNQIGYTFNFMVMFGMLLGLGMLIDGAIVVTEYADRKMAEGVGRSDAYALAAKRMFWPVTASTATTLAAFLPLIFWPGVSGKFMMYLPVTVFCVLVGSLAYAVFFGPAIGALIGKVGAQSEADLEQLRVLENGDPTTLGGITGFYARMLDMIARWPILVFSMTLLVLWGSFQLYGAYGRGFIFFNETDPIFARVSVNARGNLSAAEARDLVVEVENEVITIPGIKAINTNTSPPGTSGFRGSDAAFDRIGSIFLEMQEAEDRVQSGEAILEEVRTRTAHLAGIAIEIQKFEGGPPVGKPIQLEFASKRSALLEPAVARVREYLDTGIEGLRDIADTRSMPGVEWKFDVDRAQAAVYGANVSTVGTVVQMVTSGLKVAEYRPDDAEEAVDIRVRFPEAYRGLSMLEQLRVPTRDGAVPLSSFVTRTPAPNVDTIQRVDGIPVEYIRANVAPDVLADDKVKEIEAWLATQNFDPAVRITFRGANEEQAEAMAFVGVAFLLSLLLMFVLLVTQFNSFYQSALILFAVVMSTAGVLLGLVITGQPFSAILTGVGIVALAGIVVNNNIVLIDTYNGLRRERPDLNIHDLIVRTGAQRLRPVFLTTVTTIFGLLPIASHVSIDFLARDVVFGGRTAAFWVPLAQSIVSGLTFATLLTLVATPAMLALPPRLQELTLPWLRFLRRTLRRSLKRRPTADA